MTDDSRCTNTPNDVQGTVGALQVRQLCLEHAADLITSAETVLNDNGFPNIAYHLAILALEEIGKAGMIASRAVVGSALDSAWMDKRFDDHIWKLQWAVWSPRLSGGRIDPKDFEDARRFAQSTHARRLSGLYVNPSDDASTVVPPRAAVSAEHAVSVLNLARACLEMEKATEGPVIDEPNDDLRWYLDTVSDEQGKRRIFSKPFIDKHEELGGDTRAWAAWAREEFERIAADEQEHLQKELARVPGAPGDSKPKWVIKIRLYTPSHSIRPKVLNFWNKRMYWVKLFPVGNKKELQMELTLRDSVTLKEVYDIGLSFSKLCIVALNIGSLGFFWYDLPRQTSRYFKSIKDLETPNMNVDIGKGPGLLGEWKQDALSEENLLHAIRCIAVFGPIPDDEAEPIFGPYLQGLVLLSKSDIHLSCEKQACDAFIETLRNASKHFADWNGRDETFVPSLHRVFERIVPELDHRNQLFDILSLPQQTQGRSLADAVSAKRLTDLYLVMVADRLWSEQIKQSTQDPTP